MVLYQHHILMILLLISCSHLLGVALESDPKPTSGPLVPSLVQLPSVGDSLVFLCTAPGDHRALHFDLYGSKRLCNTVKHQTEECGAIFTVNRKEVTSGKDFCCLFKDSQNKPSAFSSYVYAKLDEKVSPLPPPVLTFSSGAACSGQPLTFHCSVPLCLRPKAVLLLSQSSVTDSAGRQSALRSPSSVVSSSSDPSFSVVPVDGAFYSCLYQMTVSTDLTINSSASQAVTVTLSHGPNAEEEAKEGEEGESPDWALVLGAMSAAVLFLAIVIGLGVIVHKRVKDAAREKKTRENAKFWTTVHARDHIVDLPISRLSICFKDTGPVSDEYAVPKSLSTFANPNFC
ncbi:hypothetical protein AALO_G00105160 [Alosa alosa]|uniref:Ig-like domain-containing protein n=1 Tax=Alosa alosa TaxID=278164 RepID=A0AAV6GZ94_9TELE|nr:uncharacterized protein LOC125297804 isoform X1 [Alosa alosa]XP_048104249.1 uncharacterized protein LOC125297804 isoform X1 [Alosa alosa]XP_048104250.1 uncharacterized protein LOC125297804 isoform X1 [Alosa alosa]XP_048104251.1 uncharacterized protein LOC125297804 isoform X1 [Alosa alosa]XP_048104252.1 uncharacterized protein LOC125297804 isoform X1 [Alosa alosa]KAG5279012.1 hypothetical protein AALO_G00105160 [Alosa alosa]